MKFNNKPNKEYKTTCGKTLWHSRNVAVCVCLIRTNPKDDTKIQVLGVKRGSAVTHSGKYCFPCGYLDWSETIVQAGQREVFEETGLGLEESELDFIGVDSNPNKEFQNVTIHFNCYYCGKEEPSNKNAGEGEVEKVEWFDFEETEKLEWAFDHKERLQYLIKGC